MKALSAALSVSLTSMAFAVEKPNIVFILADDMGIGDVSYTGGKAPTPALDRMAKEGMQFTDAHTTSSVCTPSRYGLLTGRYNWRTRLQKAVFYHPTDKPLIKKNESTVASLLKSQGYQTACIGKWHLGIGWQYKENYKAEKGHKGVGWEIDFSKPAVTPLVNGFDYYYGIPSSLDMAPYVYIENDKVEKIPTVVKAFVQPGAAAADFEANQCLRVWAKKSTEFIEKAAKNDKPFFLYLPLTSPHNPVVPSKKWRGKSPIGKYGDFLMETDWVVGEVLKTLDKLDLTKDTLVIFSTDNGCSPSANFRALAKKGHKPSGQFRGQKADIYEGGHRVPTVAVWPGVVKPGSTTSRLTTLADFYATCAEITGAKVDDASGVDSVSFLETLKDPTKTNRSAIVMHSITGEFAIREGDWKLCFGGGSGGWSPPRIRRKNSPRWQLFNLKNDPGERKNLYKTNPEKVKELHALMEKYITDGRSTKGEKQKNDVEVVLEKASN